MPWLCIAAVQSAMERNKVWWVTFDSASQCAGREGSGKELAWSEGSGCGKWQPIFLPGCGGLGGVTQVTARAVLDFTTESMGSFIKRAVHLNALQLKGLPNIILMNISHKLHLVHSWLCNQAG